MIMASYITYYTTFSEKLPGFPKGEGALTQQWLHQHKIRTCLHSIIGREQLKNCSLLLHFHPETFFSKSSTPPRQTTFEPYPNIPTNQNQSLLR